VKPLVYFPNQTNEVRISMRGPSLKLGVVLFRPFELSSSYWDMKLTLHSGKQLAGDEYSP
jgi:hypothetical protein